MDNFASGASREERLQPRTFPRRGEIYCDSNPCREAPGNPLHTQSCPTRGLTEQNPPGSFQHFLCFSIPPQIFLCFLPPFPDSSSLGNKNTFLCPFTAPPLPLSAHAPTFFPHCPLTPFISIYLLSCPAPSPLPPYSFLCSIQVVPQGLFPGGRGLEALLTSQKIQLSF